MNPYTGRLYSDKYLAILAKRQQLPVSHNGQYCIHMYTNNCMSGNLQCMLASDIKKNTRFVLTPYVTCYVSK